MSASRDDFGIVIRSALLQRGAKQKFSLFFLICLSILIFFLDSFPSKIMDKTRSLLNDGIYLTSSVATSPIKFVFFLKDKTQEHIFTYRENKILKEELKVFRLKDFQNEFLITENKSLKRVVESSQEVFEANIIDNVSAKGLLDKESPFLKSLILNKGSRAGIKKGMPVLDQNYLAGRVIEVNYLSSRILLLNDLNSKIPIIVGNSAVHAILSGSGEEEPKLEYLPEGFKVEEMLWTFNMPTDHGRVSMKEVRVPNDAIFGGEGRGLQVVQHFFNENRIRQAASSLGAAQFCINESVEYAKSRAPFGKPLSTNQGIQFPLVELQTQCEMVRALIHKTAWQMDEHGAFSVSDKVSMCNYWANRLCCDSADQAMQVHGGLGYSRHKPFEHIYRHHRRYRITEGSEEIQKRRVAGYMFGFMSQQAPKGVREE